MLKHLGNAMAVAAAKFGDKDALVFEDQHLTFNDLNDLVERMAAGLAALGTQKGDVVTLYSSNCWQWIVSYYAIARCGGIINPVNTMLTAVELDYVVQDCGVQVVIASDDKMAAITPLLGKIKAAISFGADVPDGITCFDDVLKAANAPLPEIDIDPAACSTICYTSGTTGHPKGAKQSHRAVILNGAMTAQMQMRGADDVILSALPCPHVYANAIMSSMTMFGAKLVLHKTFAPDAFLADIPAHEVTIIDGVPTMYMYMLNAATLETTDLSSLKRCYVGGQTMPVATMEAVEAKFGVPLIELWGMTEIAGLGSTHPLYGQNKHGSIGCAMPYCELRIADPIDATVTRPYHEVGELMVRGPITMMGYYGDEAKTAETLEPDGWLHTGDLASMDEDGCVWIVDRKKDMILTGGYNVYPAEIERVLASHPDVALSAVGRLADEMKGEIAKAYVVLKDGAAEDADAMLAFCKEHLSAYKCPRAIQFVRDLPKTSTGKIMRRELHTLDET